MKLAAAYIRVSTEDQIEYSPEAQLNEIRKYAASHGYILNDEHIYVDAGISGTQTSKRGEFNRMIGMAKLNPKPFDSILLWKYSRFARNREDSVVYKSMLRKQLGIDVISITEPMGDDKMAVIMEAMIEAMDEYYSINLAEEVKRGMSEKARRGELQSTPSFGYRVEENILVPVPEEADLVRAIFARYNGGDGLTAVAKWLNAQGVRTHRGNPFENRTIEYIIRNPVYVGKLRWNPEGRSRRKFDEPSIILANGKHEPLINMDVWDTAQQLLDAQKAKTKWHGRPTYEKKDWLSGLARCASCGSTLIFSAPHYMKCNNYVRGRCTTAQHIHRDKLHEAVIDLLRRDAEDSDMPTPLIVAAPTQSPTDRAVLDRALTTVQRKKDRLREAYMAGIDTVDEYRQSRFLLDAEEVAVKQELDALEDNTSEQALKDFLCSRIKDCLTILEVPDTSLAEKYETLSAIVEQCTFDKQTMGIKMLYRVFI